MNILLSRQGQARYVCMVGEDRCRIVGECFIGRSLDDAIDFDGGPFIGPGTVLMVVPPGSTRVQVARIVARAWWGDVMGSDDIPNHRVAEVYLHPIGDNPNG